LFDNGGLGDLIAAMPAFRFIYEKHPHVHVYVWIPDFFYDFAKACLKGTENRILLGKWSQGADGFKSGYHSVSFRNNHYTNLAQHMTEHAFHLICNTVPDDKNYLNYLQPNLSKINIDEFKLPEKYVVITTGFTAKVREFLPRHINTISQYVLDKGFTPVFLGKKETPSGLKFVIKGKFNTEINYDSGINLIDKTTLLQATLICSKAAAVVGLDNGILHLASCTDVPIVGGFTTVKPEHRVPYRDGVKGKNYFAVVPPESLKCRFCQSNWNFSFENVFTECKYEDYTCLSELGADLYIKELEKVLNV
jgi:ADP-heptose:LPS heptosyltransferase